MLEEKQLKSILLFVQWLDFLLLLLIKISSILLPDSYGNYYYTFLCPTNMDLWYSQDRVKILHMLVTTVQSDTPSFALYYEKV